MKRALIQNVKVHPYTSEDAIDREGFLSAVLGVLVGTPPAPPLGMAVKVTIYRVRRPRAAATPPPPTSSSAVPGKATGRSPARSPSRPTPQAARWHNIDLDLVGCKQFVKATVRRWTCTGGSLPELAPPPAAVALYGGHERARSGVKVAPDGPVQEVYKHGPPPRALSRRPLVPDPTERTAAARAQGARRTAMGGKVGGGAARWPPSAPFQTGRRQYGL